VVRSTTTLNAASLPSLMSSEPIVIYVLMGLRRGIGRMRECPKDGGCPLDGKGYGVSAG
jgi:hypothetical protein